VRIQNRDAILANAAEGLQDARSDALAILERGVDAVEPAMLIGRALTLREGTLTIRGDPFAGGPGSAEDLTVSVAGLEGIRCIAAGKAAEGMLQGLESVLRVQDSVAVAPWPIQARRAIVGGHPLPDEGSCEAGRRALELAKATGERDLLVVLLSGGASALLEDPLVPLADMRSITQAMMDAGATIEELNIVRKKLSAVKGGRLAGATKGRVLALILSDVARDHDSLVGSGPSAPDATRWGDALAIVEDLKLAKEAPPSVLALLREGRGGQRPETPKPGDAAFARTTSVVVGSNALAAHEATQLAAEMGYNAFRVREPLRGEAAREGWKLARMAEDISLGKAALPRPACIVYGGETTVATRGAQGLGGRNQEACLAAMEGLRVEATLAFLATDGKDGPTEAAGAIVDMGSKERAESLGLGMRDALRRHASGEFFGQLGDALITGPTGTNVSDLAVLLVP
jgi:hydroxypyruvate reductase